MKFTLSKSNCNSPSSSSTPIFTPLLQNSKPTTGIQFSDDNAAAVMEQQPPKSYWRFSKKDFFPEPSFESLSTYRKALRKTPHRLKDRVLGRSSDEIELHGLQKESENPLKRCLTWWDLIWLGFGSVVGSGIFSIAGQEAHNHAGPSIVLSYAASGLSALLSVFCYAEFSVEIPVAGGSFSFLRIELGDFVAFIAAANILLEAIVGAAGLGRSWSSYCATLINKVADFFRFNVSSLPNGFNLLDPVAVLILLVTNGIAMSGTKFTSWLNWISSIFSSVVIVFITIVGFAHADSSNLKPFFPFGAEGVFQAAAIVYWSYTGFDMVATMAEETKNPSRDIPLGLVGSMSVITVVYCLMTLALTAMVNYTEIDVNAAFSVAFVKIGWRWAKYLVSVVALKGMTTSLLVGSMGQARYTTQIARAHMIPPWFALVHPKTGTPIYATLVVTIISSIVSFFSSLDVLSSVLSFSTLFIFMLMAVALLVRRYYVKHVSSNYDLKKLHFYLLCIIGSSIGFAALWNSNKRGWIGYTVAGVFWFLGTLGMAWLPKHRVPKIWGVPLVPWLPSLSIAMNLFLIGSLGAAAFYRFFICSAIMLLYYVFVGVHATYDVANEDTQELAIEDGKETAAKEVP